jgi:Protein kinase domain
VNPGDLLDDRYRITRKLGAGGMGEVYLAEHVNLGRLDALKVLKADLSLDEKFVGRFRREARATNRVQHPNIVSVYDFGQLPDGRFFLAMEYAEGEQLHALIQRDGPLPVPRALHVLAQLADAIDHAHGRGVVHRDLKPENLMLIEHRGRPDVLKVLDFGLAKILDPAGEETDTFTTADGRNQLLGTPAYVAPELVGRDRSEPRIDLYATGCIALELVTGQTVFAGPPLAQVAQHLSATPTPPSARLPAAGIPPAYDALVMKCLEKDPKRRFQTGRELLAALERVPGFFAHTAVAKRRYLQSLANISVDFDGGGQTAVSAAAPTTLPDAPAPAIDDRGPERRQELHALFREILGRLLDQGHSDALLVVGVANLTELDDDLVRCDDTMDKVDRAGQDLERAARERESSLRFALGELAFERTRTSSRGAAVPPELDQRIRSLEQRIQRQREELEAELAANTDKLIALAADRARAEERLQLLYASLRAAVEEIADRGVSAPDLPSLVERLRQLGA